MFGGSNKHLILIDNLCLCFKLQLYFNQYGEWQLETLRMSSIGSFLSYLLNLYIVINVLCNDIGYSISTLVYYKQTLRHLYFLSILFIYL